VQETVDTTTRPVGAVPTAAGVEFRVWAPTSRQVEVVLESAGGAAYPLEREPGDDGWFSGRLSAATPGDRYRLRLDGEHSYPDPLSRSQPDGVHGASQIIDHSGFAWTDADWAGRPLDELVIYELHVGTATPDGTFDALVERLPDIAALGATAIEIMPVAEFAGERNWGYDGVYLFAPSRAYGGADALRRLVDAAHGHGLAVILDVVYNHFGPEGNYLPAVSGGRIFTERHHTPWGAAVNYDDDGAAAVRAIVLANVTEWVRDYHIDGLRLDAAHAIVDSSEPHILAEIAAAARAAADRPVVVIAEDERNERRLLLPPAAGGLGIDAVWADDLHHSLRRLLAGDDEGYFSGYAGTTAELARTLRQGWLYEGDVYAPTGAPRGTSSAGLEPPAFVHCIQNHDQVGNRALGERLHHQIEPAAYRAVSALLLLAPYTPLLWMGQEWAASAPFLYFTDHPSKLGRLVTRGRREEFSGFAAFSEPARRRAIPDPQAPDTFARSRLDWDERDREPHAGVLRLYQELLALRSSRAALLSRGRDDWNVHALSDGALALLRTSGEEALLLVANLSGSLTVPLSALPRPPRPGEWQLLLHTEDARFGGEGRPPVRSIEDAAHSAADSTVRSADAAAPSADGAAARSAGGAAARSPDGAAARSADGAAARSADGAAARSADGAAARSADGAAVGPRDGAGGGGQLVLDGPGAVLLRV
jgi:maltooligosyltrehalose trehalohydrolase